MKSKKTRINKNNLLYALKSSSSISQVAFKLGRHDDDEYIWEKVMKLIPEAAHFIYRNEALYEMKLAKVYGRSLRLKEIRLQFIESTLNLMKAGLIRNRLNEKEVKKVLLIKT